MEELNFIESIILWFKTNWSGILFFISLGVLGWIVNKLFESEPVKKFFAKNIVKSFGENIKEFIAKGLSIAFFFTLIGGTVFHILEPEIFPNFIEQFIVAGLALGAYSIAMATLINQAEKEKLSSEAIRYRHFSEDFIASGIYFTFAYFFWLVVTFNENSESPLLKNISGIYSVLTLFTLIAAIYGLIVGMWGFLRENT